MKKAFYKRPLFYVPTLGMVLIGLIALAVIVSAGEYVLTGHTPAILRIAEYLRHINPNRRVEIIVTLKIRNEKELDKLIAQQQDPKSADFRRFLTTDEFVARFSPTQEDVQKVEQYLKDNDLTLEESSPNRLLVLVSGKARDVEKAFHVNLNEYRVHGSVGMINDRDPKVPSPLKDLVLSVIGMNDFATFRETHRPFAVARDASGAPRGYSPQDIAVAYNFCNANNRVNSGSAYSGKGVTLAIATAYTYDDADVQRFWDYHGIKRTGTVRKIAIHGRTSKLNPETTLDLQQAGAQAPAADILMYEAKDPSFVNFTLVFNRIVCDNKAAVCSVSWGMCEKNTGQAEMKAEHLLFKQGAAQGIAFFAAAGDDGAYDCGADDDSPSVDYPSSDPYVTAVGGTRLFINADGKRTDESAWSGTGGGVSTLYDRPAWQTVQADGKDKRQTSDVALVADPATGYRILYQGNWGKSGGTSFAAPNWAAIWTLAGEACGKRLGPCSPTVYRLCARDKQYKEVFFDVTAGNNGDDQHPGFKAVTGWDHPTGWGTPDVAKLVSWLKEDKAQK